MPNCTECSKTFPALNFIEGKIVNLSTRKRCLECFPFKKNKLKKDIPEDTPGAVICCDCGRVYIYNKSAGHTTTRCNSCNANSKNDTHKEKCLLYKGGRCQSCGYDKCRDVLVFHHRDPQEKEFNIGGSHCLSWDRIIKELDKCDLLCNNCHLEEHHRITQERRLKNASMQ